MTLIIITAVILLVLISLLLVPITVCLDTTSNQYYVQLQGLAEANLEQHDAEIFRIRCKILFIKFYIYPLKKKSVNKKKEVKKSDVVKQKKDVPFKKIFRVIKTFKVKHFFMNIDTGNCISNAKLYPLFALLNYSIGGFYINFQGQNQLVLLVKNRPIDIIKSFINF